MSESEARRVMAGALDHRGFHTMQGVGSRREWEGDWRVWSRVGRTGCKRPGAALSKVGAEAHGGALIRPATRSNVCTGLSAWVTATWTPSSGGTATAKPLMRRLPGPAARTHVASDLRSLDWYHHLTAGSRLHQLTCPVVAAIEAVTSTPDDDLGRPARQEALRLLESFHGRQGR